MLFGFNVEKELLESLKKLKEINEKPLSAMLNKALRDYLEKEYKNITA